MKVNCMCTLYFGRIYHLPRHIIYHHNQTAASIIWEMKAAFYAMTSLVILMEYFFRMKEGGLQRKCASSEIVPVWLEHAQFSLEMWTLNFPRLLRCRLAGTAWTKCWLCLIFEPAQLWMTWIQPSYVRHGWHPEIVLIMPILKTLILLI